MFKEGLQDKRETFRKRIRLESKSEMLKKFRCQIIEYANRTSPQQEFDKERVFLQCMEDNDNGFQELGNELLAREGVSILLGEAFDKMRRYSDCQCYSWCVLVLVYRMVDVMENHRPLLEAYLPIVNRLCDPNNPPPIIANALKILRLLAPLAPEEVVMLSNFPSVLQEYVYDQRSNRKSSLAVGILRSLLQRTSAHEAVYARLMNLGLLDVLSEVLDNSQKHQEDFIEALTDICEDGVHCEEVLKNERLIEVLIVRFAVGAQSTKLSIYRFLRSAIATCSTHRLLKLVEVGALDILVEGTRSTHNVNAMHASLEALKLLLDQLSHNNSMQESEYFSVLKQLEEARLPEALLNCNLQCKELSQLCESILAAHFDSFSIN